MAILSDLYAADNNYNDYKAAVELIGRGAELTADPEIPSYRSKIYRAVNNYFATRVRHDGELAHGGRDAYRKFLATERATKRAAAAAAEQPAKKAKRKGGR